MTPEMLQDALCMEIRKLLSERKFKKPPKELEEPDLESLYEDFEENFQGDIEVKEPELELVPIAVYPQNIPVQLSSEEDNPVPYILVRLNGGIDENTYDSKYIVNVVGIIGIWDDERDAQGHRELLNIINLVYARCKKNPCLDGRYSYDGGFRWMIQEEDCYPYYFGAFEMNFAIPAIRREDSLC